MKRRFCPKAKNGLIKKEMISAKDKGCEVVCVAVYATDDPWSTLTQVTDLNMICVLKRKRPPTYKARLRFSKKYAT